MMAGDGMQYAQTFLAFRQLLARIRDIMAGEGTGEERLSRIVAVVAADMGAEVCSIYLRRAGEVLELFATQGLRQTAVHQTRLRFGEGLIGEIAASGRPLALANAQQHPSFVFRPETGEEIYHSLLGVPIVARGRTMGVLAIQNIAFRRYTDEEIEALQTVAMILAELVASGDLVRRDELAPAERVVSSTLRLEGTVLHPGLAAGVAVLHAPRIVIRRLVAEDSHVEHQRLHQAVTDMQKGIDGLLTKPDPPAEREWRDVLEAYRMIAADVGWLRRIGDAINTGLTAEAAVQRVANDIQSRLDQATDPYLRERSQDFGDLALQLLQHLCGTENAGSDVPASEDFIVVARTIGPADLLSFDRSHLKGVILEEGSTTSHGTIVARALDLPVLGHVRDALRRIEPGDFVVVDADHAQAFLRPSAPIRDAVATSLETRRARTAAYAAARDLAAITTDRVRITVNMNAGLLMDLAFLSEFGADGIGLYRTEIPFLVRSELPDVAEQEALYRRVLSYAQDKPVIFRTLDIGGDKILPSLRHGSEENPAMGWRAIRVASDRPAILRQQLRALVRAASGHHLAVMFPMIAYVEEFAAAKVLLQRELEEQASYGFVPRSVRVGAMLEVPALLFQLDSLLPHVDFLSVGTNDLVQFLFASDRNNARISHRYDELSPVVLDLLSQIPPACAAANVPVAVCGEMAGHPLGAMALLGLGYRVLSVAPSAVGPIKSLVRSLSLFLVESYLSRLVKTGGTSIRQNLVSYARDHGVSI